MSFWTWLNTRFGSETLAQCEKGKADLTVKLRDEQQKNMDMGNELGELRRYKDEVWVPSLNDAKDRAQKAEQSLEEEKLRAQEQISNLNLGLLAWVDKSHDWTIEKESYETKLAELTQINEELQDSRHKLEAELVRFTGKTPAELLVEILADIPPSAEAWYELTTIIADHMKIRGVQLTKYTGVEIRQRIQKLFPHATISDMRDDFYYLPTKEKGLEIVNRDGTNLITYVRDVMDCDKFSMIYRGAMAVFYHTNYSMETWSPTHSFKVQLFSDGELILEPQTDMTFKIVDAPTPLYGVMKVFP